MPSIGIMTLDEQIEKSFHTDMAKFALEKGFDVYRFFPTNVDSMEGRISGWQYVKGKDDWIERTFAYPDFLYNRCFYRNEKEYAQYYSKITAFKNVNISILNEDLPDKWTFYQIIKHNDQLKPYLPETKLAINSKQIIKEATEKGEILLKPVYGYQGRGIIVIRPKNGRFTVRTVKQKRVLEKKICEQKMASWLHSLIKKQPYIIQPFLNLFDDNHRPFDLRILLQKDDQGKWVVQGKVIRMGKENGLISNLYAGGKPLSYSEWRRQLQGKKSQMIENEISELTSTLSHLLEIIFHPLAELGIDLGIDQNGAIWLLEVTSKPGRNVFLHLNRKIYRKLYETPVQYALFKFRADKKEGKGQNDSMLSR